MLCGLLSWASNKLLIEAVVPEAVVAELYKDTELWTARRARGAQPELGEGCACAVCACVCACVWLCVCFLVFDSYGDM